MEFSESILAAAGEHVNAIKMEDSSVPVSQSGFSSRPRDHSSHSTAGIEPRLLILFQPALLSAWIEASTLVNHFLKHVDGPKGSSNDNKVLVTKAVEDTVDKSPVNLPSLLEALKTLSTKPFPPCESSDTIMAEFSSPLL
jgi:hypothetical protein